MARVLAISSQVVYGPVGNTAAVPALQALGHEVMQVPTVLLSHHPGHGKPAGQAIAPELFEGLLHSAAKVGAFATCDAVMTGYFASVEQVEIVHSHLRRIGAQVVLVDPVIGDHGGLYVQKEIASAIGRLLIPSASILTPNLFELGWFTGSEPQTPEEATAAATSLNVDEVLLTSAPRTSSNTVRTVLNTREGELSISSRELAAVPHGTGDFLAGLYLGYRLSLPHHAAFPAAMAALNHAISLSAGHAALKISKALLKVKGMPGPFANAQQHGQT
jgi:pyridoxine kinase